MRRCSRCEKVKPESEFREKWYPSCCHECAVLRCKLWRWTPAGKRSLRERNRRIRSRSGYKERQKAYWIAWYNSPEGREKFKIIQRRYWATPKGQAMNAKKRLLRRQRLVPHLSGEQWHHILARFNFSCVYCGFKFTSSNRATMDHVVPLSRGGQHVEGNVVPACRSCNSRKSDKEVG